MTASTERHAPHMPSDVTPEVSVFDRFAEGAARFFSRPWFFAMCLLLVPDRVSRRGLILLGMLLFTGYFALVAASAGMPLLIGTQVARGVALAVVGALGITYMQDLAPHATGRATTMFANTLTIGSLVSGVLAGAAAQAVGYRAALLLCGVLVAAGCAFFLAGRPRPATVAPASREAQAARR